MSTLRRYAWAGLLFIAVVVTLFGLGDIVGGISADEGITIAITGQTVAEVRDAAPAVARLADLGVALNGVTMLTIGLLWAYIVWFGLRVRQRWAWGAMWSMPLWMALVTILFATVERAPDTPLPPPLISGPILLVTSLVLMVAARPDANDAQGT